MRSGIIVPIAFIVFATGALGGIQMTEGARIQADVDAVDDAMTSFVWESAPHLSGPAAFFVTLDLGHANDCRLIAQATSSGWPGPSVMASHSGQASVHYGYSEQVHANGLNIDTRDEARTERPPEATGLRKIAEDTFYGEITMTVASPAFDGWLLGDPEYGWLPAAFYAECAEPFSVVRLGGSREVLSFTDQTMSGTGASVVNPPASLSASVGDSVDAIFSANQVHFRLWWVWLQLPEVIDWTLDAGAETVDWTGLPPDRGSYIHVGGPGEYRFTLNRIAANEHANLVGWMLGDTEVASLDEI